MSRTIRNLDEAAYREIKARAALSGRNVGELISEAVRSYLTRAAPGTGRGSLRDLVPEPYPPGNDHLSEEIDSVVYGE